MTRWQWLGVAGLSGAILLMSWLSSAIWAQQRLEYPRPCPNSCVPNAKEFGHFETKWRRWPGEVRLEQINPHIPNSEIFPTPEGREVVPAPKATIPQQQPPSQEPRSPAATGEGDLPIGLSPPSPTKGTVLPTDTPEESKNTPSSTKPTVEGELPGLPPEPEPKKPPQVAPPPKAPAKPPATKPQKNSLWEDRLKPRESSEARVIVPAQPANTQLAQLGVWQENGQPTASAATPLTARGTRADAVVALAGGVEPERNAMLPGAYRADSIAVTPNSSAGGVEPAAYAMAESPPKPAAVNRADVPSVALGGYCPVELSSNGRWVSGDLRFTVVYQGWIYRLSGTEQRRQFLADPDRFAPVNSSNDVVLSVDKNCSVPGQPAYCATYNNRLYMFSSQATQAEFNRNPERYAAKR